MKWIFLSLLLFSYFLGFSHQSGFHGSVGKTVSNQTSANLAASIRQQSKPRQLCEVLKTYPRSLNEKLSFQSGEISSICRPFVSGSREEFDRCGDVKRDPYSAASSQSGFTWASRNEMAQKGKGNLYLDSDLQPQLPVLLSRVEELRESATQLCCGEDQSCRSLMKKVAVDVCKPSDDASVPDPCVFGGSFRMPGRGYDAAFKKILEVHKPAQASELGSLIARNLTPSRAESAPEELMSGTVVLSSYVSKKNGIKSLEPVILHEFGHACSIVKMQMAAISKEPGQKEKSLRAAKWLDKARSRCQKELELPESYRDFWISIGESESLFSCLRDLTLANQRNEIDKPCSNLCPGHYMEETVGVAFSVLLGEADGSSNAAFPNTCNHVRDGQHPMVADVIECLAQHSTRFRTKLADTYSCQSTPVLTAQTDLAREKSED